MFNNGAGYSLSDIAAISRGNNGDGTFGDSYWWIILLFLFSGWGGNGFGGGNETVRDAVAYGFDINGLENSVRATHNGLSDGFYAMNESILTSTAALQNAMCNQGYNTIMSINDSKNAITMQLHDMAAQDAACCCDTQRLIERGLCELNYNILTQSNGINQGVATAARDIIENANNNTRAILDFLTQDKITTLQSENQNLKFAASQQAQNAFLISELAQKAPIPAYTVPNPYASYGGCQGFGGCCG